MPEEIQPALRGEQKAPPAEGLIRRTPPHIADLARGPSILRAASAIQAGKPYPANYVPRWATQATMAEESRVSLTPLKRREPGRRLEEGSTGWVYSPYAWSTTPRTSSSFAYGRRVERTSRTLEEVLHITHIWDSSAEAPDAAGEVAGHGFKQVVRAIAFVIALLFTGWAKARKLLA